MAIDRSKISARGPTIEYVRLNFDGFVKSLIFPFSGFPPLPSQGQALRGNDNKAMNIR